MSVAFPSLAKAVPKATAAGSSACKEVLTSLSSQGVYAVPRRRGPFDSMLYHLRQMHDLSDRDKVLELLDSYDSNNFLEVLEEKLFCGEVMVHNEFGYQKTWLSRPNDKFLVGLYHWTPGGATPLHDHGDYATAYYKVVGEKSLTNVVYEKLLSDEPGKFDVKFVFEEDITPWHAVAVLPWKQAHIVANRNPEDAFSIHIYTPKFDTHRTWHCDKSCA